MFSQLSVKANNAALPLKDAKLSNLAVYQDIITGVDRYIRSIKISSEKRRYFSFSAKSEARKRNAGKKTMKTFRNYT